MIEYLVVGVRRRVHRVARIDGILTSAEGCNIDAAGHRAIVSEEEAHRIVTDNAWRRCRRCWRDA